MCKKPIRIAITGITGRMGKAIVEYFFKKNDIKRRIVLGAVLTRLGSSVCGVDIGTYMKTDVLGIRIADNIELIKDDFDMLIDFTSPDATIEYLKFCMINNKNIVIGTTGFNQIQKKFILHASKKIGIVCSANFSIGITVMLKLLYEAAKILKNTADINIIDIHHSKKRDAPSGTALMMRHMICNALQCDVNHNELFNDHYFNYSVCSSKKEYLLFNKIKDVAIHSLRIGDVVGEHTVLFACFGERLEISHKVFNREIFVYGVLRAVMWLDEFNVKQGLFDLRDVLGLNN